MRRLVYSPKVNVWVKSDFGIIDLSDYITNVSVNRKTNQVSGANVTFRNPGYFDSLTNVYRKQFTEQLRDDGSYGPMFHPMDPIVISMTRYGTKSIQVFTGYCDTTPYLALYPGTVSIEASCTLKRLQYTFWDPGLPFVMEFMSNYGWQVDQQHGGIINNTAETSQLQTINKFNDGSIANLLFAVLKQIGGWDESIIYIESLPPDIGATMTKLYKEIEKTDKDSQNEFESLLTQLIGTTASGSGGADNSAGTTDSQDYGSGGVPQTVYCAGVSMGVSNRLLLAAMSCGLVESPTAGGTSFGNPGQAESDQGTAASGASAGWRQETALNYPNVDRTDVRASAKRFYTECKQLDTGQAIGELVADVQRPAAAYRGRYQVQIDNGNAQKLLDACKALGCPVNGG